MNYRALINYLPSAIVVVLFIVGWQAYVVLFHIPSYLLPTPTSIASILASPSGDWIGNSWTTLYETIAGFVMAVVIGIPLAIALMYSVWFNRVAYPIILLFQVIPKVALAPLIFLLMNFGLIPRIVVTFLVAFFPII
ncbi:MAG: ABC transporter permease, partial [Nitrososphaerota archaeon]|nr:ABC transporter permease [Nitrososphaerota archaeon]